MGHRHPQLIEVILRAVEDTLNKEKKACTAAVKILKNIFWNIRNEIHVSLRSSSYKQFESRLLESNAINIGYVEELPDVHFKEFAKWYHQKLEDDTDEDYCWMDSFPVEFKSSKCTADWHWQILTNFRKKWQYWIVFPLHSFGRIQHKWTIFDNQVV